MVLQIDERHHNEQVVMFLIQVQQLTHSLLLPPEALIASCNALYLLSSSNKYSLYLEIKIDNSPFQHQTIILS